MGFFDLIGVMIAIAAVASLIILIAVGLSKSSTGTNPPISPVSPTPEISPSVTTSSLSGASLRERPISKPPVIEDGAGKWTHTKAKEKFIPQDTVYEYRRVTHCMLCPFCDAENDIGATECQVCRMSFRRGA